MTITRQLVGTYADGDTVGSMPSGSNRLALISIIVGGGETITGVSINGQAATEIQQNNATGDSTALYYIKEADLPLSGGALAISGSVTNELAEVTVLSDVNQTAPITASGIGSGASTQTGVIGVSGDIAYTVAMRSLSVYLTIGDGYTIVSDLQGSFSNRGNTAYKDVTDTSDNVINWLSQGTQNSGVSICWVVIAAASSGLTIDSTDASMQRNTNFQVVCSTPTTTPTTGNTTLTNGNDTLTPTSVTGSDPYTLTFPVGDLSKQVDGTGYDWTLEITP